MSTISTLTTTAGAPPLTATHLIVIVIVQVLNLTIIYTLSCSYKIQGGYNMGTIVHLTTAPPLTTTAGASPLTTTAGAVVRVINSGCSC